MITANVPPATPQPFVTALFSASGDHIGYFLGVEPQRPTWRAGLVFGYDLASTLDPTCNELHKQTIGRCKVAARSFRDDEIDDLFIVCRIENGGMKMAELMKTLLIAEQVPADRIHVVNPGFNTSTITEIQVFLEVLKHVKLPPRCKKVIVTCSSWYHTERIKMVFKHFGFELRDWNNADKCSFMDITLEILKLLFFWAIPGAGKRFEKIELPRWVTDPEVAEGAIPATTQA